MLLIDNHMSRDAAYNLALEQYAFDELSKEENVFMLWQNANAIIVGRHQNTVEEINQEYVDNNNIQVIRRLTGGGAVYHDMGNLNFTFITHSQTPGAVDLRAFTEPVVRALRKMGVPAEFNSRNDIAIEGKKFSGNAQYTGHGKVLHHGTLLFNSRLDVLSNALKVKPDKIRSKGVTSVRSRVTNIVEYLPEGTSLEEFRKNLIECLFNADDLMAYKLTDKDKEAVHALCETRYNTWEWNYGKSPQYDIRREAKYPCGLVTVLMTVYKGRITKIDFYGDYFGNTELLAQALLGKRPIKEDYEAVLDDIMLSACIAGMTDEEFLDLMLNG